MSRAATPANPRAAPRRTRSPSVRFRASILAAYAVLGVYGGLILATLWFLDPGALTSVLRSERTWFSVRLSLGAATVAASLAVLCALPAAYALSRHRFAGRAWVDAILELPMIVSPAALGAMLLMFFSQPLGQWIQTHLMSFVFTVAGVMLAQFVTVLGVAVRLVKTAFDEVPMELETVARTLGAGPQRVFWTITFPLARRGVLAAFVLAWAKALGEFGATIMLAGTMAMRTETLPIAIYLRLSAADLAGTAALIVFLLVLGISALALTRRLLGRGAHA
jgi:molybdate transport system permease protein